MKGRGRRTRRVQGEGATHAAGARGGGRRTRRVPGWGGVGPPTLRSQPCATFATFSCSMMTSCSRRCHSLMSERIGDLIWNILCAVWISRT